jgi:uncharacterized protein YcfL
MKKILTLLLLFTLVGFLSANQVIITNDYQYIVSTGKTYNFNNGNPSNNVKYDRTNKIQIQNNKVIANPLKYHYAFFWQEDNTFIGYYKTNKGLTTSGAYLGQVNTQSIPLPLNAYSFALVRYDNDYVLVNGYTIEELFIDNNLAGVDPADFNDIPIAELNGLTLNDVFDDGNLVLNGDFKNGTTGFTPIASTLSTTNNILSITGTGSTAFPATTSLTFESVVNNTNYYLASKIRTLQTNTASMYMNIRGSTSGNISTNLVINFPTQNLWYDISSKTNISTTLVGNVLIALGHNYTSTANANGAVMEVYYAYAINITSLGISSLTKAQLDTYFSIYQNGVNATYYATDGNVSSVDGHYYAATKNLFNKNTATLDTTVAAGGNVVSFVGRFSSDFIEIKPGITYTGFYDAFRSAYYDINKTYISESISGTSRLIPANTKYVRFTGTLANINTAQLEQGGTATAYEAFATPTTTLNLTFLFGIGNEPNKATMDGYYAEYEEYLEYLYVCCNIFSTQTISFETIYFDDGVSTEIERLGSILIFTLIGFTLMIFGFASKRRIFNLLAVGAFVVLGFLLIEFVGFIIILFGLIFVNVYYTFFGEL